MKSFVKGQTFRSVDGTEFEITEVTRYRVYFVEKSMVTKATFHRMMKDRMLKEVQRP